MIHVTANYFTEHKWRYLTISIIEYKQRIISVIFDLVGDVIHFINTIGNINIYHRIQKKNVKFYD